MKHIVFFSGGLGSWATAKRILKTKKIPTEDLYCLFTDTLIEDEDLYRFMLETTQEIYNVDNRELIERIKKMPPTSYETMEDRKRFLTKMGQDANEINPNFIWINNGRDPWDIFIDMKYLRNSRFAACSHELKQQMSSEYVHKHFDPEDSILYLGIDWTEAHRVGAPTKNWLPYRVEFPLCDEPYVNRIDFIKELEALDIPLPRLYTMGFAHNNCGGFCVRAGQGHFINLLENMPDLFDYHEKREQEIQEVIGKEVTILRRMRGGVRYRLSLKQLREEYEEEQGQPTSIDLFDIGGCGCFIDTGTDKR